MTNFDFIMRTEKEITKCPKCKVDYEKHHWSPGGVCAPCSNGVKDDKERNTS